jgi:hypothetical protein
MDPGRKEGKLMSEVQACLLILTFNAFLFVMTLVLILAMLKLYTEIFKQWKIEKRTRSE